MCQKLGFHPGSVPLWASVPLSQEGWSHLAGLWQMGRALHGAQELQDLGLSVPLCSCLKMGMITAPGFWSCWG